MDLVVDPAPDGVKLPGTGYTSGSLQDNVTISNDKGLIGGHLKYTTGMVTMYPDDRLKQEGNFIALWLHEIGDPYVNYDKIEAKVVNGAEEKELEVSDEGYICFRVDDRATTKLVVTVTIGEQTYEKEFKLTALTIDEYGWNILKETNLSSEKFYSLLGDDPTYKPAEDIYSAEEKNWRPFTDYRNLSLIQQAIDYGWNCEFVSIDGELPNEWIKTAIKMSLNKKSEEIQPLQWNITSRFLDLKMNTTYTVSFYARHEIGNDEPSVITVQVHETNDKGEDAYVSGTEPIARFDDVIVRGDDSWKYYSHTFTTPKEFSDPKYNRLFLNVGNGSRDVSNGVLIAGLKLEEGDHATGWDDYYSGDNALLDTDQPTFTNVNENLSLPSYYNYRRSDAMSEQGRAEIQFISNEDLPSPDLLINNKYVIEKTQSYPYNYVGLEFRMDYIKDVIRQQYGVKDGDPVTVSAYIKMSQSNVFTIGTHNPDLVRNENLYITYDLVPNEWNRVVYTFIQNSETFANLYNRWLFSCTDLQNKIGFTLEICGIKIEKGAHVTPYRPAPSDFNINYLLNSNLEKTTEDYGFGNVYGISSIKDISYNIPVTLTVDGDVGEGKYGFTAYNVIYTQSKQELQSGIIGFCGADNSSPPPSTIINGRPFIKNNIFGYVGTYTLTDPISYNTHYPEMFDESSKVVGTSIYVSPKTVSGVSSTLHKLKLEVGRYPTKWVDGTGDPAYVASDEDDRDLEVT